MAYWFTYPATDSDNSDGDEGITDKEIEQIGNMLSKEVDFEIDFFDSMGQCSFLYQFSNHIHPKSRDWMIPVHYSDILFHFDEIVDQKTLDSINIHINGCSDYSNRTSGNVHWTNDQLEIIFSYAQAWVHFHSMGRNNYINDICWVASQIMLFQISDHLLKTPKNNIFN